MSNLWRTFFGFSDDDPDETYDHAVGRARALIAEGNHEEACRILRYAERYRHAEAMAMLAQCHWSGTGVVEDAGRALSLWKQAAALGYEPAKARYEECKNLIA